MERMNPEEVKRVLGEKEYERLFERSEIERFDRNDLVKLSYFFRRALGVRSEDVEKKGAELLYKLDAPMYRKKISESVTYVKKKLRKAETRARKIRQGFTRFQAVFRGSSVRRKTKKAERDSSMCTVHVVTKRCAERRRREKEKRMMKKNSNNNNKTKTVRRRSAGTVERINEIKQSRQTRKSSSSSSKVDRRKQSRMFHSDWLKKFDVAFDKMVYESDRV